MFRRIVFYFNFEGKIGYIYMQRECMYLCSVLFEITVQDGVAVDSMKRDV